MNVIPFRNKVEHFPDNHELGKTILMQATKRIKHEQIQMAGYHYNEEQNSLAFYLIFEDLDGTLELGIDIDNTRENFILLTDLVEELVELIVTHKGMAKAEQAMN